MFSLNSRVDGFRFLFPKTFLAEQIREKYGEILARQKSIFIDPVDFLNESIKSLDILGITNGTVEQRQTSRGLNYLNPNKISQDRFLQTASDTSYRSPESPLNLIDKTFNVKFRHTLGYINYFMIVENFFYQYSRDYNKDDLNNVFNLDLLSDTGSIISKVQLFEPVIFNIDNLSLNFTEPVGTQSDFNVGFKFSNIDYQFLGSIDDNSAFSDSTVIDS